MGKILAIFFIGLHFNLDFGSSFNFDTHAPIYKCGSPGTYFGYSVAQHFKGDSPVLLVGAPRAQSDQVGTNEAGAIFSCPLTTVHTNYSARIGTWCSKEQVEYANLPSLDPYSEYPSFVNGHELHHSGKNQQLLGSVIVSSGQPNSRVVVCTPLLRYHNSSAYTDGTCYVLDDQLERKSVIHSCASLDHSDRHNNFGACLEGFSAHFDQSRDMVVTGLPGARKWMGGVFGRLYPPDQFDIVRDRWTMDVDKDKDGVRTLLAAHDYLGFSVKIGRFGFWYEDDSNVTIVSGATRFEQSGAVVFLPFRQKYHSGQTMNDLSLLSDDFMLKGDQLGSAFGYSLEVFDVNNDGFDDLLVGAPFHYVETDQEIWGGSVFVYFSRGIRQKRADSHLVFHDPVQLNAGGAGSQFGLAITKLGDVDQDPMGINGQQEIVQLFQLIKDENSLDFAISAPFSHSGKGSVFIYHGALHPADLGFQPKQTILADDLATFPLNKPLTTFGFSLSGGADLDFNGYPDLLVGAFGSDSAILLRSRPVINLETSTVGTDREIDRDQDVGGCPAKAHTWSRPECPLSSLASCMRFSFEFRTELRVLHTEGAELVDLTDDVFLCRIQVLPFSKGVSPRAKLADSEGVLFEWKCGRFADRTAQTKLHRAFIRDGNRDWLNPLKFRFSVEILDRRVPEQPAEGDLMVDLNRYPVLNERGSRHEFSMAFNKKCGSDKVCVSDLDIRCSMPNLRWSKCTSLHTFVPFDSVEQDGTFVKQVDEAASIDYHFWVRNRGERAYESALYLTYDPDELDVPSLNKISGTGSINVDIFAQGIIVVSLGNPLQESTELVFKLTFQLTRGKSRGLGKELVFSSVLNSTSKERNTDNDRCSARVKVIRSAELELVGVSQPAIVRYGGPLVGESDVQLEEDVGPMVTHRYTVSNHGPWSVSNVSVTIYWPYQVQSVFLKGKWALYPMELPTIATTQLDGKVQVRRCTVDLPSERINPLDLKINTIYSLIPNRKVIRTKRSVNRRTSERARELRIKPKLITEKSGEIIQVVQMNCEEHTAKCFPIKCHFEFIDKNAASIIDIRARLWNSTFVEDYRDVEYVSLSSWGVLETNPPEGLEDDPRNNRAKAATHAYPDVPRLAPRTAVPWWSVLIAVLVALFILSFIVFFCWKCGFFRRNRYQKTAAPTLYQAEILHTHEEWTDS